MNKNFYDLASDFYDICNDEGESASTAVDKVYKILLKTFEEVKSQDEICPQCKKYTLLIRDTYKLCTKCGYNIARTPNFTQRKIL